jgi:transcriptional regulator with XRE-family HTH domain
MTGENIRRLRLEDGISRETFARFLGVCTARAQQIESKRKLTPKMISRCTEALSRIRESRQKLFAAAGQDGLGENP